MLQIEIAAIDPVTREARVKNIAVPDGSTARAALAAAGVKPAAEIAIFNERSELDVVLSDGDRIDVLSPLLIDPMTARRLRAEKKAALRDASRGRHGGRHRLMTGV